MSTPSSITLKKQTRLYLLGAAAVLLILCVCVLVLGGLGTGALVGRSLVAQSGATSTAVALAALYPPAPPAGWPVLLSDNFSSNANGWSIPDRQPETNGSGTFRETIADGKFQLDSQAAESVAKQFWPKTRDASDLYASVDAQRIGGDVTAAYGMVFHWNTQRNFLGNFYFFQVRDDRQFGLFLYAGDWIDLIGLTGSDAIRPGAVNHLAVRVLGAQIVCFINDRPVGAVLDDHEPAGIAGLGIDMNRGQASFQFSRFEVRAPP